MGKLDDDTNFINLYMYHIGKSEVPRQFHLWACLSLIAACVGDSVWVQRDRAKQVYPNLFVFLIGPSGSGKESAVNTALGFIKDIERVNAYPGKITGPALWDFLSLRGERDEATQMMVTQSPRVYFVTEELGACIRAGELAFDLITMMTSMFMRPPFLIDGTRTRGYVKLIEPCINWIAGTTDEWLVKSIPRDAIEGGFWARVLSVRGQRNHAIRYPTIQYPEDYEAVKAHLKERVEALTWLEGGYRLSEEAQVWHDQWYMKRIAPAEKLYDPAFNRGDEMVYKLALLLALADWPGSFDTGGISNHEPIIEIKHLEEAVELWDGLVWDLPETIKVSAASPETGDMKVVQDVLDRAGTMERTPLMRKVSSYGLNKERLDAAIVSLLDQETIKEEKYPSAGIRGYKRVYTSLIVKYVEVES